MGAFFVLIVCLSTINLVFSHAPTYTATNNVSPPHNLIIVLAFGIHRFKFAVKEKEGAN